MNVILFLSLSFTFQLFMLVNKHLCALHIRYAVAQSYWVRFIET